MITLESLLNNDNSDTIGRDSIKACRAFKETVSTNIVAVQGAIKYINFIQTNNFSNFETLTILSIYYILGGML